MNSIAAGSLPLALVTLGAFVAAAVWFSQEGEQLFQEKDCPKIVIDEVAGFLLANFLSPADVKAAAVAFLLFRFFDIIKPFPANRAERLPGGVGVVADDLVAGLYALVILRLLIYWGGM